MRRMFNMVPYDMGILAKILNGLLVNHQRNMSKTSKRSVKHILFLHVLVFF